MLCVSLPRSEFQHIKGYTLFSRPLSSVTAFMRVLNYKIRLDNLNSTGNLGRNDSAYMPKRTCLTQKHFNLFNEAIVHVAATKQFIRNGPPIIPELKCFSVIVFLWP